MANPEFTASEMEDPDETRQHGSSSASSCVFNLCNTVLGGGVSLLALPLAAKQAGLVLFVFIVAVMALLTGYTCDQLQVSSSMTGVRSFTGLSRKVLGPCWAHYQSILVMVNNFGIAIALLQAFKDVVPALVQRPAALDDTVWGGIWVAGATAIILVPVALVQDIGKLAPLSQFALLGVVMFWFFVICQVGSASYPEGAATPATVLEAFNAASLISLSFTCHFNVLPIFDALGRQPRRYACVLWTSMALTCIIYLPVGIIAYLVNPTTDGDILKDFSTSTAGKGFGTFLALGLVGTIPLFSLEGIHSTHGLLHCALPRLECAGHLVIAVVFMILAASIAVGVPLVGDVLSMVGCLAALPMMFILPPLIYIRTPAALARQSFVAGSLADGGPPVSRISSQTLAPCSLRSARAVLAFGVLMTCVSTYATIVGIASKPSGLAAA